MSDPYLYPHTDILKNLADMRDGEMLSCMEAEYTSIRLAELVTRESVSRFDFAALCDMHYYIFQDIYEWAGKIRIINIEKSEPALGGISIEYSDCFDIEKDAAFVLERMNHYAWETATIEEVAEMFSKYLSDLFKDNVQYMRTALVAASALFLDLGDKRKPEYLEKIVLDALERGKGMKQRVSDVIKGAGFRVTEKRIRKIVYWNRLERYEHRERDVRSYLLQIKKVNK